ncbi:hypothetical protein DL93DRAFT_2091381, partial [Clavulina sp. PMI_390]
MPFQPSPYASPANGVVPLDYDLNPGFGGGHSGRPSPNAPPSTIGSSVVGRPGGGGGYHGDHSPQSGIIPSGQSDHNS